MKIQAYFLIIISFYILLSGCKNENNNDIKMKDVNSDFEKPCHCIMDTLKGEWSWYKTYTAKYGLIDNEFKSILKVLNQNEDSSINYEVFVEDTLYFRNRFQYKSPYDNRIDNVNIKLPHWIPNLIADENWIIHFGYLSLLAEIPSESILCFWDGSDDGYFYYYKKTE
jgi:hypothetical protein